MSWLLLAAAIGVSTLMGYLTYKEDKFRGRKLPFKDVSLVRWLQSSHHWHSFGHYFMDMVITFVSASVGLIFSWTVSSVLWSFIVSHPIGAAFLAMMPSTLLTLWIEIVHDGHWRFFIGKDVDARDFGFDLATHFSGGLVASLLLAAIYYTFVGV